MKLSHKLSRAGSLKEQAVCVTYANEHAPREQVTLSRWKPIIYDRFVQFAESDMEHSYNQTSREKEGEV